MKTHSASALWPAFQFRRARGFALIVTLSLMILLTVIAVGLLTLSSISLRSTNQTDAMQAARANARIALMLAIGDLQKQLGPDPRISTTADQLAGTNSSSSAAPQNQRQWAGAYNSWPEALPDASRPTPEFLQWFVSGDSDKLNDPAFARSPITGDTVQIVTANSVGPDGDPVTVPLMAQTFPNGSKTKLGWWVSDLGTKSLVTPAAEIPDAIAEVRADQQTAPASNLQAATSGTDKPFAGLMVNDSRLTKVSTWQSTGLVANDPQKIRGLFHDLTTSNRGLLTNVRSGGFRKDLSMELERRTPPAPTGKNVLYTVNGETGINFQELWTYYNLCSTTNNRNGLKWSGGARFTTGGTMASGTPHLQVLSSPSACRADDSFYFKQPIVISYQVALSLQTRRVGAANRLHLVADPIVTMWNPLDVPVSIPTSSFLTVKYWQIPYDLIIRSSSGLRTFPMAAILSNAGNTSDGDSNYLSMEMGATPAEQIVFKPGEVIKFSQSGTTLAKESAGNLHRLAGRKGFNYGGGLTMPVRDRSGAFVDIASNETISFQARPNNLTAGATSQSGRTANSGGTSHNRHYSLTHHEYYVGPDRAEWGDSLGIGNMAIDWDFGNKRLRPAENRGTVAPGIAGTKPSGARLYANDASLRDVFISIPNGRSIPAANLATNKQPIMLLSFNAKTEGSSDRGTRTLARFNPKALHIDFYDLSAKERDMLPFEYSVEALQSWKNRSLETSSTGNAYFGGALNAQDGTSFVSTHSVPREPIVSLAAFQHSFANGFDIQRPKYGYGTINAREPMMPQISHAIGNSMACPVLPANQVKGTLNGVRPLADHSYLANTALWDSWFLSGITHQTGTTFGTSRDQKTVASEFFDGTAPLPCVHYRPELHGKSAGDVVSTYLSGVTPSDIATAEIASLIRVDGLFNVNSTSVEAWKNLLGARKQRPVVVRDGAGKESIQSGQTDTPVAGLMSPMEAVAPGQGGGGNLQDSAQWVGRRTLNDTEIERLAQGIVEEVRKRGPFLSLADFVNRRVGSDTDLARAGAIQNALDSDTVGINSPYQSGTRAVDSAASGRFTFGEAEDGPKSYGAPGIIKQADILTPIAPILSARSDSFMVRGYGEKVDQSGKVIARAWCEAVVQRSPEFIDPTDKPETTYSAISPLNKTFGRRFEIVSFRWLSPQEA
ncbi:MAG: hypothetical protein V4640_03220 [Verrucomicrobiota bacterium]